MKKLFYIFKTIFYLLIVASLYSCKTKIETEIIEIPALKASALFNQDSVLAFIQRNGEKYKELSDYYNKKSKQTESLNIKEAIYFQKRAISVNPNKDGYLNLISLLKKVNSHEELGEVLNFLIYDYNKGYIFGKPEDEIYYESIVNSILSYGYFVEELYTAEANGIKTSSFREKLLKDERLKNKSKEEMDDILINFLSEDELKKYIHSEKNFNNFLAAIKDTTSNFEILGSSINEFSYRRDVGLGPEQLSVSDYFIHYLQEKKDQPDKWLNFNLKKRLKLNNEVNLVVYSIDTSELASSKEMRHIYYRLVSYDSKGNILDSKVCAWQSGESLATLKFMTNQFYITEKKRIWKRNYDKKDPDNYVTRIVIDKETRFNISPEGKIIEDLALHL